MNQIQLFILITTFFFNTTLHAGMAFMGFKTFEEDSTTLYKTRNLGDVQLQKSVIRITHKGSYLDITEEAWITGQVDRADYSDNPQVYSFQGSISLPNKSVITGIQVWKNNSVYRAKLKPVEYNFDESIMDSLTLQGFIKNRIILLHQLSPNHYGIVFSDVDLGEVKRISLRYMLPNTGGGLNGYTIPVVFNSQNDLNPQNLTVDFRMENGLFPLSLDLPSGIIELDKNSEVVVPYQNSIKLDPRHENSSVFHISYINSGIFQGHYTKLNTQIPDSLLKLLNKPVKTFFIWQWENTHNFITRDENNVKTISFEGHNVLNKAQLILNAMEELGEKGFSFGLIHLINGEQERYFPPAEMDEESFLELEQYLKSIDIEYLFDQYKDTDQPPPIWSVQEVDNQTDLEKRRNSFKELLDSLPQVMVRDSLFRPHLIFMNSSVPYQNPNMKKTMDDISLPDAFTVDFSDGAWLGVDLKSTFEDYNEPLTITSGLRLPVQKSVTLNLEIETGEKTITMPIDVSKLSSISMIFKSETPWNPNLKWTGYDSEANTLRTWKTEPLIIEADKDTGLTKIWAGDGERQNEFNEFNIPAIYGIVSNSTFLKAVYGEAEIFNPTSGSGGNNSLGKGGSVVPYLTEDEIELNVSINHKFMIKHSKPIILTLIGEYMEINVEKEGHYYIYVYDIQGKLIGKWALFLWGVTTKKFRVPTKFFKKNTFIIVRVRGVDQNKSFKLHLGGVK